MCNLMTNEKLKNEDGKVLIAVGVKNRLTRRIVLKQNTEGTTPSEIDRREDCRVTQRIH